MLKLRTLFFLIVGLFATSCMDECIMDPIERKVYVNCILTNDSVQRVEIAYSSHIAEIEYLKIKEADVKMYFSIDTTIITCFNVGSASGSKIEEIPVKLDTSGVHEFVKIKDGVWQAEFVPIEFAHYALEVDIPEYGKISARTCYPPMLKNIRGEVPPQFLNNGSNFTTHNQIITSIYESIAYDISTNIKDCSLNIWIVGQDYDPKTGTFKVADYIYTNHNYVDNFNLLDISKDSIKEFTQPENVYTLELADEDDDYYKYINPGMYMYLWGLNFDSSPIYNIDNIYGNRTSFIPWPNDKSYFFHDRYLRLVHPGDGINVAENYHLRWQTEGDQETPVFTIGVNFKPYKYMVPHPSSHLIFQSVSNELDKYYKDLVTYTGEIEDLTTIWNISDIVYSNIKNGLGIFGAAQIKKVTWGISQHYYESYIASQSEVTQ